MKILIVRGAFGDMYEPAWFRALTELGHEVCLFDCHAKTGSGLLGRIERRILAGPSINKLRLELISVINNFRPEVTLLYQGHYIDLDTVNKISNQTLVVGYHNDNPFGVTKNMLRYRHLKKALSGYHGFHVYRPSNLSDLMNAGISNAAVLMPAFMPWMDYPRTLNDKEYSLFACDVLFAGHCEADFRVDCFYELIKSSIHLKVYGDPISWKKNVPSKLLFKLGKIGHILGDDYRNAIAGAKITLCFFSKKNNDVYTRRVFEITACGGFLLCERTKEMNEIFPEGIAADYFSSAEELLRKVNFYLKNPEIREQIARRGYEIAIQNGHDLHTRLKGWLCDVSEWREKANLAISVKESS